MKDFWERVKDILYNISDYLIMGSIVLAIALIIGWRLDILFPQTIATVIPDVQVKAEDRVIKEESKDHKKVEEPQSETIESKNIEKEDSEVAVKEDTKEVKTEVENEAVIEAKKDIEE